MAATENTVPVPTHVLDQVQAEVTQRRDVCQGIAAEIATARDGIRGLARKIANWKWEIAVQEMEIERLTSEFGLVDSGQETTAATPKGEAGTGTTAAEGGHVSGSPLHQVLAPELFDTLKVDVARHIRYREEAIQELAKLEYREKELHEGRSRWDLIRSQEQAVIDFFAQQFGLTESEALGSSSSHRAGEEQHA